jgi:hypothetical protein
MVGEGRNKTTTVDGKGNAEINANHLEFKSKFTEDNLTNDGLRASGDQCRQVILGPFCLSVHVFTLRGVIESSQISLIQELFYTAVESSKREGMKLKHEEINTRAYRSRLLLA